MLDSIAGQRMTEACIHVKNKTKEKLSGKGRGECTGTGHQQNLHGIGPLGTAGSCDRAAAKQY